MVKAFITTYPELIAAFVALLMTLTSAVLGLYVRVIKNRIEAHITREEDLVWNKIDERFTHIECRIQEYQDKANARHEDVIQRLVRVENKIPNGELKRMANLLEQLVNRK